jgi:hypothetical protein
LQKVALWRGMMVRSYRQLDLHEWRRVFGLIEARVPVV